MKGVIRHRAVTWHIEEGDYPSSRTALAEAVGGTNTCQYLGSRWRGAPPHRVWEYRDIGRPFITVGGERVSDTGSAEVGSRWR